MREVAHGHILNMTCGCFATAILDFEKHQTCGHSLAPGGKDKPGRGDIEYDNSNDRKDRLDVHRICPSKTALPWYHTTQQARSSRNKIKYQLRNCLFGLTPSGNKRCDGFRKRSRRSTAIACYIIQQSRGIILKPLLVSVTKYTRNQESTPMTH